MFDSYFLAGFPSVRRISSLEEIFLEDFKRARAAPPVVEPIEEEAEPTAVPTPAPRETKSERTANVSMPTDKGTDSALADSLWTVKDAARFLKKSPRWVFYALQNPDTAPGSIPHTKLGRNPCFIPDDLRKWAEQGFPPAAAFRAWKEADARRARRN